MPWFILYEFIEEVPSSYAGIMLGSDTAIESSYLLFIS